MVMSDEFAEFQVKWNLPLCQSVSEYLNRLRDFILSWDLCNNGTRVFYNQESWCKWFIDIRFMLIRQKILSYTQPSREWWAKEGYERKIEFILENENHDENHLIKE